MNRFNLTTDTVYNKYTDLDITIIHLSDIHFNVNTKETFLNRLTNYINKQKPDYIMITGDLIDTPKITNNDKIKELFAFLETIGKISPVLIAIGNHDVISDKDFAFFEKINKIKNVNVLNNEFYVDKRIAVFGLTLPINYYYNVSGDESVDILLSTISKNEELWKKNIANKPLVLLVHSPIKLTEQAVLDKIKVFDIVLCGHTHNGMVPKWLYFMFPENSGIVSPTDGYFPKIAKGKIEREIDNKTITIIINGAVTKMSKLSGKVFSNLNFLYDSSVNKIVLTKERRKK